MWAASVVKSRSFFLSAGEGQEPVPVLVPVADVFNLKNDVRTDVSMDPDTKLFRLRALHDVPKGQQARSARSSLPYSIRGVHLSIC
jgi:hypothetical protein